MTSTNDTIKYIREANQNAVGLAHQQIALHQNQITKLKAIITALGEDDGKYASMLDEPHELAGEGDPA